MAGLSTHARLRDRRGQSNHGNPPDVHNTVHPSQTWRRRASSRMLCSITRLARRRQSSIRASTAPTAYPAASSKSVRTTRSLGNAARAMTVVARRRQKKVEFARRSFLTTRRACSIFAWLAISTHLPAPPTAWMLTPCLERFRLRTPTRWTKTAPFEAPGDLPPLHGTSNSCTLGSLTGEASGF